MSERPWTAQAHRLLLPLLSMALGCGVLLGAGLARHAAAQGRGRAEGLELLARVMALIEARHLSAPQDELLVQRAIRGMAEGLDPHSGWMDAASWQAMQEGAEGRSPSVGLVLRGEPEGARVIRVLEGSPAELAGVRVDDRLVELEGQDVRDLVPARLEERLRGERGTAVVLGLLRGDERLRLELVRDHVFTPSVELSVVEPGLAYARIERFQRRTAAELSQGLGRAERGSTPLRGLLIDLRDNPGGLLDEAVAAADLFLAEGLIVETRGRGGEVQERHEARRQVTDRTLRLVLLINEGTASAAEVLAGALQDHGRARLVGSPSHGKGSVQTVTVFEDGSALRLTVASYHLPSGRHLEPGAALEPDLPAALPSPAEEARRRLIEVVATLPAASRAALEAALAEGYQPRPAEEVAVDWERTPAERLREDPQVKAAWALLRQPS